MALISNTWDNTTRLPGDPRGPEEDRDKKNGTTLHSHRSRATARSCCSYGNSHYFPILHRSPCCTLVLSSGGVTKHQY